MRHLIFTLFLFFFAQLQAQKDALYLVEQESTGLQAYINTAGDTIIPAGTYEMCFTQVFSTYAIVLKKDENAWKCVAINRKFEEMYEVFWFDNGPDFIEEGLFRIVKDDKIGYANKAGKIVIEPVFACAEPFQGGKARVTYDCTHGKDGEYTVYISDSWFNINKKGKKVK